MRRRTTDVPFGVDLLFRATDLPGLVLHVEICEDMWVPVPPSAMLALRGATVLANISGIPDHRRPRRGPPAAGALGVGALPGGVPVRRGRPGRVQHRPVLGRPDHGLRVRRAAGESERFPDGPRRTTVDVDLTRIRQERLRQGTFDDNRHAPDAHEDDLPVVEFTLDPPAGDIGLRRRVDRFPFVPDDPERLALDCYEAYNIQVSGLEQRLAAIGGPKVVIGVSGGLDSTHALIVAANAMDRLGRPRSDIHAFTLPGFATSDGTKANATRLSQALGVTFEEIDIRPAARQLLEDLDHPFSDGEPVYDVTFENVQAGLRTDYLFRLANHRGGIVLGTGDLSELALGWCTYGVGDQMSHYAVNTGVPKTLIQHLIRWVIGTGQFDDEVGTVLRDILDQEISPELVPVAEGERPQSTEDAIGPYALQDFTLFHVLRHGMPPSRIAFLAEHAWSDADAGDWPPGFDEDRRTAYDLVTIRKWLEVFVQALLRVQPVQAVGPAERPQGALRRVAVPAR